VFIFTVYDVYIISQLLVTELRKIAQVVLKCRPVSLVFALSFDFLFAYCMIRIRFSFLDGFL